MKNTHSKTDLYFQKIIIGFLYVFVAALPFSIAVTQISLTIALVFWLARVCFTKGATISRISLEWGFLAFIAAALLSLFFSTNFTQSFIFLKRLLLIPIVYLIAHNTTNEKQFKHIVILFLISISLYSFSGILSYFQNPSLRVRHIQNSMTAGGITMVGSLVSLAIFAVVKKPKWRYIALFLSAINILCLFLTNTRGSWLGFLVGMILIFFFTNRKLLWLVPVLIISFYFLAPDAFQYRVKHMFDPHMSTNAKRLTWWHTGWEIFKDHPIVGIGDVSTQKMYKKYVSADVKELIGHFHSNYVHIAVTLGSIGFLAFLYMITIIFQVLLRIRNSFSTLNDLSAAWALAALAIFLAFNINGFFEWNFGDAEVIMLIWFTTGLSIALRNFSLKHNTIGIKHE